MKITKSVIPTSWVQIKRDIKLRQAIVIFTLLIEVLSILLVGFYLRSYI